MVNHFIHLCWTLWKCLNIFINVYKYLTIKTTMLSTTYALLKYYNITLCEVHTHTSSVIGLFISDLLFHDWSLDIMQASLSLSLFLCVCVSLSLSLIHTHTHTRTHTLPSGLKSKLLPGLNFSKKSQTMQTVLLYFSWSGFFPFLVLNSPETDPCFHPVTSWPP